MLRHEEKRTFERSDNIRVFLEIRKDTQPVSNPIDVERRALAQDNRLDIGNVTRAARNGLMDDQILGAARVEAETCFEFKQRGTLDRLDFEGNRSEGNVDVYPA